MTSLVANTAEEKLPSDDLQHIQFEGCDVCVIAPEDFDALTEANKKLREALAELLAAELSQMPPGDDGIEAQNAWADRRAAARNSAAMLLKVTP
jgi:hypothetical protein